MPDAASNLPERDDMSEPPSAGDARTPSPSASDNEPRPVQPGTSFVIDFDLAGLMAGLGIDCGTAADQEAIHEAEQDALAHADREPVDVPGRVAALMPAGPALAAWLAPASTSDCGSGDLADIAAGYRRLAAWAQAGELTAVAEMAARTAERRGRADPATRQPDQVLPEAGAEVGLALTMSQLSAMDWTGLASQLRWQLPCTAAALSAGRIDLSRARIIAQAVAGLGDKVARSVEEAVLPDAGSQTTGQLRAAVRRAVIAADPDGADQRRDRAERHARVSLYADDNHTATVIGTGLPAVRAAAAFARITAMARALKAAGNPGGMDYLRAYVMLGLLLGTLPPIGAAPGTPPDAPPPADDPPGNPLPPDQPPAFCDGPATGGPDGPTDSTPPGNPLDLSPGAAGEPPDIGEQDDRDGPDDEDESLPPGDVAPAWPPLPAGLPYTGAGQGASGPLGLVRPPEGLLDVLVPWSTYTGATAEPAEPAVLGRYGPITPSQSSELLSLAASHPGTQWRIILTDAHGFALEVDRFRLSPLARGDPECGPLTSPVIGRLTVTVPAGLVAASRTLSTGEPLRDAPLRHAPLRDAPLRDAPLRDAPLRDARLRDAPLRDALLRAVGRASARAGPADASPGYRPSPRLREYVCARDVTCTFPPCRQPAWRTDLDHTVPWHLGGATSAANLGARCRTHHKIKQLSGWRLEQSPEGAFAWTTPAGNTYLSKPRRYPI